jgi:16S rRNA processing protein RimM
MEKENCFYLGKVTKSLGFKGEVVIFIDADEPENYHDLDSVFIELGGNLIPFFTEYIGARNKNNQITIKFQDIDTVEQSSQLQGSNLYLPLDLLPPLDGNKFYFHEVEGFIVIDKEKGEIGVIGQILDYPGNPLFEINQGNRQLLIPVRDEFIQKVDKKNRTIYLDSPEGLIDIYLDDNADEKE